MLREANRVPVNILGKKRAGALKLRSKLTLSVLSVAFIIFAAVIAYVALSSGSKAGRDAESITLYSIKEVGAYAQIQLNRSISILKTVSSLAEAMDRNSANSRNTLVEIIKNSSVIDPNIICMWFAFEPDAFDRKDKSFIPSGEYGETGQFIASFVNDNGRAVRTNDVTSKTIYEKGSGDYYTVPLQTGKTILGDPVTFSFSSGKTTLISSISVPIHIDGKTAGVVGIDFNYENMQNFIRNSHPVSKNSMMSMVSDKGIIIYYPAEKYNGQNIYDRTKNKQPQADNLMKAINNGELYKDNVLIDLTGTKCLRMVSPLDTGVEGYTMSLIAVIPVNDIQAETISMTINTIIAAVMGFLVMAAVMLFISNGITRPIIAMADLMERAGAFNVTTDSSKFWLLDYKDEIGTMGRSYLNFQINLTDMLKELNTQAREFAHSAQNLAAISEESVASMEEVKASVDEVARISHDNSISLEQANTGVSEVSQASTATAHSSEEGAAIAGRTADLTRKAFNEVDEVVSSIRQAGERSTDSGHSIQKVNESVGAIASFVSTITGIADQTNLLALNAAIEAARAGEAGRGFAVVAEEVRKLAEESALAAQEVQKLITVLQSDSGKANSVIEAMGKLLTETIQKAASAQDALTKSMKEVDDLSGHMQTIAAAAEEQAASSSEMAESVNSVTTATLEIGTALEHIQSATADTAVASESVAEEAQGMTEGVIKIEQLLDRFNYDGKGKENEETADAPKKLSRG